MLDYFIHKSMQHLLATTSCAHVESFDCCESTDHIATEIEKMERNSPVIEYDSLL